MKAKFNEESYQNMLENLFNRFPTFQKEGLTAYKPGLDRMICFDKILGQPHKKYKIIHVAGTNGKGSVSNILASVLAASGYKVGLYTSPHILDFRERMRVRDDNQASEGMKLISHEEVWDFVQKWSDTFEHLDLSFFEITTMMALDWFSKMKVDVVVLETGLGGRLDSTNIVNPVLSVITNIGLDHCNLLGETLPEIAFEKAGIIKPSTPVVVGEGSPEIDEIFERKVLYTNLSEPKFVGSREDIMCLLTFADKRDPALWEDYSSILEMMDLQGEYQYKNLRTVLSTLDVLKDKCGFNVASDEIIKEAIVHTAERMDFHGRWEKLMDEPLVICDIGHNEQGLKYNFAQLKKMQKDGVKLIIVYGSVQDKKIDAVIPLMPKNAYYIFTQAKGKRNFAADKIEEKFKAYFGVNHNFETIPDVGQAVERAMDLASKEKCIIYIGGSTFIVSEAIEYLRLSP